MPACPTVKHVVVYKRTGSPVNMVEGRDHWWHDLMAKARGGLPGGAAGFRGSALHSLHLGDDGKTQGPGPHNGRLCGADVSDFEVCV